MSADLEGARNQLRDIDIVMGQSPDKSYARSLDNIAGELSTIKERISKSSIPPAHSLRHLLTKKAPGRLPGRHPGELGFAARGASAPISTV